MFQIDEQEMFKFSVQATGAFREAEERAHHVCRRTGRRILSEAEVGIVEPEAVDGLERRLQAGIQ